MGCYEAVLEAIPSIFIMTIIMISANGLGGFLGFRKLHYYNYECDSPNRTATYIHEKWEIEQTLFNYGHWLITG